MLEFVVPEQFEEQAKELICQNAVRFASRDRAKILENIIHEFKGGEIAPRMSAYSVKYNEDGTTTVKPLSIGFSGNEYALLNIIDNEGQTFMINREGRSICIAPFSVNDVSYLRTFDPAEAPTIRETLGAALTPPKEPSFYDKVCDFFATHILNRHGKAVQEYIDKKAYYDAMQKGLENLTGISDKVAGYKQEQTEELKRIEQEQLEKQQELEKQKEQERIQQEKEAEELRKRTEEETRRKIEEEQKRQMDQLRQEKEAQFKKFEPEKEKAMTEAEKKFNEFRLQTVRDLQHSLPKKIRERDSLAEQCEKLKNDLVTDEKNLGIVKERLAKEEQRLKRAQDDLTESKNTLKDLANDLKEMEKLKELQPQKNEQKRILETANTAIPVLKEQIKEAELDYKKCADEYSKVSGAGHIYVMTPEQYLQYNYNQAREGREQMLQQQRAALAAQMKELENQIQVRDLSNKQIKSQTKAWEYIPLINLLSDKPEIIKKEKNLKADLEKQYEALQKQDQELVKEFEEREVQHKKLALDYSPENLRQTEEFLRAGFNDTKAKQQAFKNADERVEKLKEHLAYSRGDRKKAQENLDNLNRQSKGKDYDEALHDRIQKLHDQLKDQINSLTKQCSTIKSEVNDCRQLVKNSEFDIQQRKDRLPKMNDRYRELDNDIDRGQSQLVNFTRELHKAGIAVEPSPDVQQPQQPQAQQAQHQPKSPVMGNSLM